MKEQLRTPDKKAVFYGKSQVGLVVLLNLIANGFQVKVMPNDDIIRNAARYLGLPVVNLETMGECDLFVSCHGERIIPVHCLPEIAVNMHDCLYKYKGQTPIQRYIDNGDTQASIESHHMTAKVDMGPVVYQVFFETPKVKTFGEYYNLALPRYLDCIEGTLKELGFK